MCSLVCVCFSGQQSSQKPDENLTKKLTKFPPCFGPKKSSMWNPDSELWLSCFWFLGELVGCCWLLVRILRKKKQFYGRVHRSGILNPVCKNVVLHVDVFFLVWSLKTKVLWLICGSWRVGKAAGDLLDSFPPLLDLSVFLVLSYDQKQKVEKGKRLHCSTIVFFFAGSVEGRGCFRLQTRAPYAEVCMLPAGKVWGSKNW